MKDERKGEKKDDGNIRKGSKENTNERKKRQGRRDGNIRL